MDPPRVELPCGLLVKPINQGTHKLHIVGKLPLGGFAPPFKLGVIRVQP